jgi:asparaginyl-tRNA synthetase
MLGRVPLRAVVDLRTAVLQGIRQFYQDTGVPEVRPPILVDVTGACENVDTLLAVSGSRHTGSESPPGSTARALPRGYLSQTGQLSLEQALVDYSSCWCHTTSFRDDEPDSRHLREFELIEEEFGDNSLSISSADLPFALFDKLLGRIEAVLRAGIEQALHNNVTAFLDDKDHSRLRSAQSTTFPRVTYDEALEISNEVRRSKSQSLLSWGQDITPSDELAVVAAHTGDNEALLPTFITLFPTEIKFFNMKCDPRDTRRVLSADLILPLSGETVGAAVREDNFDTLRDRLVNSAMFKALDARGNEPMRAFGHYLDLMRQGRTAPHAGYGIGLERLLQFVAGTTDIRELSLAYQLGNEPM